MIPRARLNEVTESDILNLIENGVRESRTLDYKRDWPADRDARAEIAKDVCAFANTMGGDIVFGVDDRKTGVAVEIVPVVVGNLDQELLALTSYLRDTLEPRVAGALLTHEVSMAVGGNVVILRVAPSLSAPHRVTKDNHFYTRTSVGKAPMDIHGIRHAFAAGTALGNDIRTFRDDALSRIVSRENPVPELNGPLCVCHFVPVSAFSRQDMHSIDELLGAADKLRKVYDFPLSRPEVNLDGAVCVTRGQSEGARRNYAQLYRNGVVEVVYADLLIRSPLDDTGGMSLFPELYEIPLVRCGLRAMAEALATLGVVPPAYLMLSWLMGPSTRIAVERPYNQADFIALPAHLSEIIAPPVYIEDFSVDPLTVLRPVFDVIWNAVGVAHTKTDFAT